MGAGEATTSLARWMSRRAQLTPERRALTFEGRATTFAELQDRILRRAAALAAGGVGPGDRVGYLGLNDPAFLECLFATSHLGAVFVPLSFRLTGPELAFVIGDAGIHTLIADDATGGVVDEIRAGLTVERHLVVGAASGWDPPADLPEHEPAPVAGDDIALIMYTSGTTGRPKGAMLTHDNLFWNNVNVLHAADISVDDITLVCAPLFHIGGLNVTTLTTWQKGGEVVLMRSFEPSAVLELIREHRVTTMFGVPAMFLFMRQCPEFDATDLSSVRFFVCGGAPVPEPLIHDYSDRGITFLQAYGLTETSPFALLLPADRADAKVGSAGLPLLFTEVALLDDRGGLVAEPGVHGEICVRGPNVMRGYWHCPEATAEAIDQAGWFHTGDVGRLDDEGYVYVVDRVKDMVITGGENVYPAEVEAVLFEHPMILDVAVVGLPDDRWGEAVTAVAVLDDGPPLRVEDLRDFAGDRLARFKLPTRLELIDELPRNPAGKVLKRDLRERFAGSVSGASQSSAAGV